MEPATDKRGQETEHAGGRDNEMHRYTAHLILNTSAPYQNKDWLAAEHNSKGMGGALCIRKSVPNGHDIVKVSALGCCCTSFTMGKSGTAAMFL